MKGEEILKRAVNNGASRAQELDRATQSLRECLTQSTPVEAAHALSDVIMDCCKLIAQANARLERAIREDDSRPDPSEAIGGLILMTALATVIAKLPESGCAIARLLPDAYKTVLVDYELFDISMSAKEKH